MGVHRGAAGRLLVHVQLGQDPQEGGLDEGDPRDVLQPQGLTGDGVDVPQTDALKKSGLIELDEGGQRLVQALGKVLPAVVAQGGQGDEVFRQIELP